MSESLAQLRLVDSPAPAAPSPRGYLATRRLLSSKRPVTHWLQWLATGAIVIGLLYVISVAGSGQFSDRYQALAVVTAMLMAIVYHSVGVFSRYQLGLVRIAFAWTATCALIVLFGFLTKTSANYSRPIVLAWFAAALVAQCVMHLGVREAFRLCYRRFNINVPSVVIGSGWLAAQLTQRINANVFIAEHIVGVIDEPTALARWKVDKVPVLATLENLESALTPGGVERVYIALPGSRADEVAGLQERLLQHNIDVIWVPDIFAMNVVNPSVGEIAGIPLISLSESPLSYGLRAYVKSLIDVSGAIVAVIALSPILLAAFVAVRLTSKGPALYRQARTGWDGMPFEIWKFRTMYLHDEGSTQLTQARKDDARITRVGRILRRTSIDELPQLFNVLAGSMSLVGPRPHSVIHNHEYCDQIRAYLTRHRVKPGITGLAQVNGCRGEIHTIKDMAQRVEYDLDYINNWSLTRDLWILLRTPYALLSSNAY